MTPFLDPTIKRCDQAAKIWGTLDSNFTLPVIKDLWLIAMGSDMVCWQCFSGCHDCSVYDFLRGSFFWYQRTHPLKWPSAHAPFIESILDGRHCSQDCKTYNWDELGHGYDRNHSRLEWNLRCSALAIVAVSGFIMVVVAPVSLSLYINEISH